MSSEKYTIRTGRKKIFSQRLARALECRHWSQSDLARWLGIKPAVVQRWCAGVHLPTGATLRQLENWIAAFETPAAGVVHDPGEPYQRLDNQDRAILKEVESLLLQADDALKAYIKRNIHSLRILAKQNKKPPGGS